MKKLYIFLVLIVRVFGFGQSPYPSNGNLSPEGLLDNVFDHYGNKYSLKDIKAGANTTLNNTVSKSVLLCNSGIFDLYFETGCGMESTSDITEIQRRTVVCQVFSDLSNFIISPLQNAGNTTRVKIWVRKISNINGVQSNTLGLATAFYNIPYNSTAGFGGIADNEVWKTIISGKDSYTNVSYLLDTFNQGAFYHGLMAFNFTGFTWNTNLNINSPSGEYDLYSVVLHEVTHALGFVSLMNTNGQSVFGAGYNYFSRYDKFLKNNAGTQSLLTNGTTTCSPMYNYNFNSSLSNSILHPSPTCLIDQTNCATAIKFFGTSIVPVYTPNCFEPGSSLSHFEDLCVSPNVNNQYFTMSNANGTGVTKRFLRFQERNALADIGYKLNTTYGNSLTTFGNYSDYGGVITSGINVAGTNDGRNTDNTFTYFGNVNSPITINSSTDTNKRILANDTNAVSFECLEDVGFNSTFSATSGNSLTDITFTSSVALLHLLRYVPVNSNGQRGNITYIYVVVNDANNCGTAQCVNLVTNGDFEQYTSLPTGTAKSINELAFKACNWKPALGSPDYFHVNATGANGNLVSIPCNVFGYQNVNNGGSAYAGMIISNIVGTPPVLYSEMLLTKLSSPLLPNVNYQLSFDISLSEGSDRASKIQAFLSTFELPPFWVLPTYELNIPTTAMNMLFTNPTFTTIKDGWERITFNIPARPQAGEQYLYLGGLKNVQFLNVQSIQNTCNNLTTYTSGYYYLDNVTLIPLNGSSFNLPSQICTNVSLQNLSIYLNAISTGGVFTGNGVVNNNGIYSFNATSGVLGPQTITYTYTNSTGCIIKIYGNIAVIDSNTIPTFLPIAQICSGSTLSVLPSISTNSIGISGTWSPAFNNTATTTYTFTPNAGQCYTTTTLTITVLPASDPSCISTNNKCNLLTLTLSVPEPNASVIYRRQNYIITNTDYSVTAGQNVEMRAGDFVSLRSNTFIKTGALFLAKTEPCSLQSKTVKNNLEIKEYDEIKNIVLFPNPNNGSFELINIDKSLFGNKQIQLNVYDLNGRNLFSKNLSDSEIPNCQVNLQQFMDGMYIVKLNSESYSQDFKFIKK